MKYSPPVMMDLTPEMVERLDKFRDEHENDPIGNVADEILFEDDNVRIWRMTLKPGEASDLHSHAHDYYLIIMSGDLVAGVTQKDFPVDSFVGVIPKEGNTVPVPKGGTEWAYNVGEETYDEYLIELKNT
ncbi:MAG: hypothetical protein JRH10_13325 [Deltaproteobacteria bacterium]|nr:hypothetical protein [Deltaproteobacteria bacterium]MBW2447547.1 hypothetical protein [Deltaproteobacteria bacterium]